MHKLVLDLWRERALTIFMVTHDLKEGFHLGTRLWVFDKPREDPHKPEAYGATITYDLPLTRTRKVNESLNTLVSERLQPGDSEQTISDTQTGLGQLAK
jgi:NitT/TauT family transport system ATP-binding protein